MSYPRVGLHVTREDLGRASVQVMAYTNHTETGHLASVSIGDQFVIFTTDEVTASDLADTLGRLAGELRRASMDLPSLAGAA